MNVKLLVFALFLSLTSLGLAQQIPNGGFEDHYVDSLSFIGEVVPNFWKFIYTPEDCAGYLGELTNDSHSGNWAVELETVVCTWSVNGAGIYTYPQLEDPYTAADYTGYEINASPYQLSFYSKFTPVEGDTALVYARLFNYPDTVPATDPDAFSYYEIIATAEKFIVDSSDQYTQQLLTFDYESADTPKYISIVFLSHGDEIATPGTTLLIDDVELIYLPTSLSENTAELDVQVSPNPVLDRFEINYSAHVAAESIALFDFQGRLVKMLNTQDRFHSTAEMKPGLYVLQLKTNKGLAVEKLVKAAH